MQKFNLSYGVSILKKKKKKIGHDEDHEYYGFNIVSKHHMIPVESEYSSLWHYAYSYLRKSK